MLTYIVTFSVLYSEAYFATRLVRYDAQCISSLPLVCVAIYSEKN